MGDIISHSGQFGNRYFDILGTDILIQYPKPKTLILKP